MQSIDMPMNIFYLLFLTILATTTCFAENPLGSLDKKVEEIVKVIKTNKVEIVDNKKIKKIEKNNVEAVKVVRVSKKKTDGSRYILNCAECHGFDGNSADPQWPNIAGLNKDYISRQLQDFKSGKRVNEEMTTIVREFPSDDELESLADYFSKQKSQNPNSASTIEKYKRVNLKLGEEIFTGKRLEYGIPACSACHGKDGLGDKAGKFPQLVGQHMDYIVKQMQMFRSKERNNDTPAQMRNIARQMDDEDIESVSAYISYMSVR